MRVMVRPSVSFPRASLLKFLTLPHAISGPGEGARFAVLAGATDPHLAARLFSGAGVDPRVCDRRAFLSDRPVCRRFVGRELFALQDRPVRAPREGAGRGVRTRQTKTYISGRS